jgi:pyruvate-formate lyase
MSVSAEVLKNEIIEWDNAHLDTDVVTRDALIIERLFLESPIKGRPDNLFFYDEGVFVAHPLAYRRRRRLTDEAVAYAGESVIFDDDCFGYTGFFDLGHTAPDFKRIFELGLPGLLARLEKKAEGEHSESEKKFYDAGIRVWRAALKYVERAAKTVCNEKQAAALTALSKRPPETLYEAIQLTFLYYVIQHWFDGANVRTLGRLDELYEPFRAADIAAGRLDEEGVRRLVSDMYREFDEIKITANMPFAVGGTGRDGKTSVNAMSYILMEEYARLALPNVKLHFLYTDDMPRDFVKIALGAVRDGANSICFMGDKTVSESLVKLGEDAEDARDYAVVGCYECGGRGEITCS